MSEQTILGVRVKAQRYSDAVDAILNAAREHRRLRCHFCAVHSLVEASDDVALRSVFASADMVATDGMPLVWVCRARGAPQAERVCGPDMMASLCDLGREQGLRHYFVGGRPGVPQALAERLAARFPGLVVVGTESPPFRALAPDEDEALVQRINDAAPDVLWVGLGAPKQEFWAAGHADALTAPLILPVGAAFDFHAGRLRRAPRWMQRTGLEWLFRLASDPRRLWRRYLVTNSRFVLLLAEEEFANRRVHR
ncbi:MAG: WecB/TagA/CpsF family glycosyltransferase [Candidatus Limnocylindrales bacterium]